MIGRRLQIGICLDLARGIVAMEDGKMDFQKNEAGRSAMVFATPA